MASFHRMQACAAFALVAVVACGDDRGFASLDDFYAPGEKQGSSDGPEGGGGEPSATGATGVTCSISTSSLLAYLSFDGDGRVRGSSSFQTTNEASLSFVDGISSVGGMSGSALRGSDQIFMKATRSLSLSAWTACAWVRVASSSNMGFLAAVAAQPLNSGIGRPGITAECGGGELVPYLSTRAVGCLAPSSSSLPSDRFTFLCMVSDEDAGGTQIYVDGSRVATTTAAAPLSIASGASIAVGGGHETPPGSEPNALDEFSFWGRALSSSEMTTLAVSPCRATGVAGNSEDSP